MWSNVDIYKLGYLLLPPTVRRGRLYAFMKVLLQPFFYLVTLFKEYRRSTLVTINTNGQVIYIEKALNDAFAFDYKYIYLTDTGDAQNNILYPEEEKTMAVYQQGADEVAYLTGANEGKLDGDFIVNVPDFLDNETDLAKIKEIVEFNKPAGRGYVINVYTYE